MNQELHAQIRRGHAKVMADVFRDLHGEVPQAERYAYEMYTALQYLFQTVLKARGRVELTKDMESALAFAWFTLRQAQGLEPTPPDDS